MTGVKPYYVKDNVVQNKGYHASRVVCKSKEDAEICCAMLNLQSYWVNFYKKDWKKLIIERDNLKEENEQLKQFKENVINWVDSQMKFNAKKYIETEDDHFKSENIDLHNFKVFIGIDSDD